MSKKPVLTGAIYRNRDEFFKKGKGPGLDTDKGSRQWKDPGSIELQDGYSFVAHQDAPDPVAYTRSKTSQKGGGFKYGEKRMIYKKVEQKQAPAQQAAPAVKPEPEPEDDLVIKQRGPVKYSPEIQEAKERVNKYQESISANSVYTPQKFQTEEPALNLDKYKFNAGS